MVMSKELDFQLLECTNHSGSLLFMHRNASMAGFCTLQLFFKFRMLPESLQVKTRKPGKEKSTATCL